jgi:predicted nucleic acid-binding protein
MPSAPARAKVCRERAQVVVDNSAMLPAFLGEDESSGFDAGLVVNRSRALVRAIRGRQLRAFVPTSFYREFLNNACRLLEGRTSEGVREVQRERVRDRWQELLDLPLVVIEAEPLLVRAGQLSIDEGCPSADSWYVAAAEHADATLWMSHRHRDDLYAAASRHVPVSLLSDTSPI